MWCPAHLNQLQTHPHRTSGNLIALPVVEGSDPVALNPAVQVRTEYGH